MKSTNGASIIEAKDIVKIIEALKDSGVKSFKYNGIEIEFANLTNNTELQDNSTRMVLNSPHVKDITVLGESSENKQHNIANEYVGEEFQHLAEELSILSDPTTFESRLQTGA
ncbi:MAG: hypothetical protein N4A33_04790 [Bacteriovoracaceae bacterium]|jgi:hypothetical protein|nr:hypothetical protein [Bacteriovoracaceae bacterium]